MAMTLTVDDLGKLLHSAASSGDVAEIKRLLGAGAPVDWKSAKDNGTTALFLAASKNHVEAAELLIQRGANVNVQTAEGWSPLMAAAGRGHAEVGSLLLDQGADMDAEDESFNAAMAHSAAGGHPDWAKKTLRQFAARSNTAKLVENHRVETEALKAKVEHLKTALQAKGEQMEAVMAAKQKHIDSLLAAKQEEMEVLRAAHAASAAKAADKFRAATKCIDEFKALALRC